MRSKGKSRAPILYLVRQDPGTRCFEATWEDTSCDKRNLVVITHGWYEWRPWPALLALAIHGRVDATEWQCGWYDWRRQARRLFPSDAAEAARDEAGPLLGHTLLRLSREWRHIHLIGHSAGAWVVNEAARTMAKQTSATMHLTLLDSYVPKRWDPEALGAIARPPDDGCWTDHYFTRDRIGHLTENILAYAHNIDITDVNPGFNGHHFPRHWYYATILGRYATSKKLANQRVVCEAAGVPYGYLRGLEAGADHWALSVTLPPGGPPVRMATG